LIFLCSGQTLTQTRQKIKIATVTCSAGHVRRQQVREAQRVLAREEALQHCKELHRKAWLAFAELKTFVALADHTNGKTLWHR